MPMRAAVPPRCRPRSLRWTRFSSSMPGSSSVKFQVFAIAGKDGLDRLIKGQMDGIGVRPRLRAYGADGTTLIDQSYAPGEVSDPRSALETAGAWLRETQKLDPVAVGHRIAHGGPDYDRPVLIDSEVLARLDRYVPLAPLHQPNNLAPVRSILARTPNLPQVGCFDTSFHRGHSAIADHYAIPERLYAEGVRRYGFHGLSYEYIASRLPQVAPQIADGTSHRRSSRQRRIDVRADGRAQCRDHDGLHRSGWAAHGHAARADRSRSGALPVGGKAHERGRSPGLPVPGLWIEGAVGHQQRRAGARSERRREGSGSRSITSFIGSALQAGLLAAASAASTPSCSRRASAENSPTLRARIAERLGWLGARLDPVANAAGATLISRQDSRIGIYVVPTDEELMIARHTVALIATAPGR